jgi:DNA-directed RNA polymerase subunit RPC12/RpoP
MELHRHCPACGRKFHVKLVDKKLVRLERESGRKLPASRLGVYQFRGVPVLAVQEGRPIVTDIEEFQYAYRCGHCGHEWLEKHVEEHKKD